MYSKEERERVLSDFHASGLPLSWFSALPGSPCRPTLRSWLRQEEAGLLDVPAREVRGRAERPKHQRYGEETRREAVRLYSKGMRAADVARRLGVSSGATVARWARLAEGPPRCATMPARGSMPMDADERAEVERLREELEEARMRERVLLELMRDPKAGDPERLSNKQKTALGERLRRAFGYSQRQVTAFFGMPRSTYAYDLGAISRDTARARLVAEGVRRAFEESGRTYGYRRVRAAMAAWEEPLEASEREVRRAMRDGGMVPARTRRRGRYNSYAGEPDERPANLPLRDDGTHDFSASAPGRMVVTDVTEFAVGGRKVYLSPIIDCFDGLPAAWSVSAHPDSALCDSSLEGFLASGAAAPGVVCHTDGGGCYRSASWKRICADNGVVRSMSRKGRSPDNARAEGVLRDPQGGALQRAGVGPVLRRGVRKAARRLHRMVPGREAEGLPGGRQDGVRYGHGPQEAARVRGLGMSKILPQSLCPFSAIKGFEGCRRLGSAAPRLPGWPSFKPQGLAGGVPRAVPQPPSRPRRQRRGPFGEDCVSTAPCPPALPGAMEPWAKAKFCSI